MIRFEKIKEDASLIVELDYVYRYIIIKIPNGYWSLEIWEKEKTWQHELVHAYLGALDNFVHTLGLNAEQLNRYREAIEQCTCDLTYLLIFDRGKHDSR